MQRLLKWWNKFWYGEQKQPTLPARIITWKAGETLYDIWKRSQNQQNLWEMAGWKWIHQPFWYCTGTDDPNKGARCAQCHKWVERESNHSLEVHEMNHWD